MTASYLRFLAYLVSVSYAPVFLMPRLLWYTTMEKEMLSIIATLEEF
jgi:hypothetical protein